MGTPMDEQPAPPGSGALHANEQAFRLLVESVREYSIYLIDPSGNIASWNNGARRIKGYDASEIVGKPYGTMFTPEDRAAGKPARLLAEARRVGAVSDQGWRVRKDSTRFWASVVLTAMLDEAGVFRGYAKVTHDETVRHEAEERLRRSEERFRLSIDSLKEHAFYVLDPTGMVESWNSGAERIKGYAAAEIIGQHFSVFFTDDDRVAGKPKRELELATRLGSFEEEGWRVRRDGTRFWASVVVTAIRDGEGRLRGFAKVTRDETAKHQANVELQQALERARVAEAKLRGHAAELERRVEERTALLTRQAETLRRTNAELEHFAYIASHDLKEPLRLITNYLDILGARYAPLFDERARGYFETITSSATRMGDLVEAVLEYSRQADPSASLEVTPVREVVDTALALLQTVITDSGATIEIGELPTVRASRVHLVRVFQNLIGNAIKFRSDRPLRIAIAATPGEGEWVLSVRDNGIGIDPQFHGRLFKIFQRLHAAEEYPGNGIGLASCLKIIERHGGRIWVESAAGVGSTFRFSLLQ